MAENMERFMRKSGWIRQEKEGELRQKSNRIRQEEEEEIRQKRKRLRQEEEEEEREIAEYALRLEYMLESCSECDQSICGLIEEQQGGLNILSMRKREFLDDWESFA